MRPRRELLDLLLVLWTVGWLVLALQVAAEVRGLKELTSTVTETGAAVRASGETLSQLAELPLVGDELREPAQRIEEDGNSAAASGRPSRDSVGDLSVRLALVVAVLPTVSLLGVYLHLRRRLPSAASDRRSSG
jgi:hypothetical protein